MQPKNSKIRKRIFSFSGAEHFVFSVVFQCVIFIVRRSTHFTHITHKSKNVYSICENLSICSNVCDVCSFYAKQKAHTWKQGCCFQHPCDF